MHNARSPVLDVGAAALAAQVHPRTIRRWVACGRLTNHGTPRRILLDPLEVEAWTPTHRAMRRLRDCLRDVP